MLKPYLFTSLAMIILACQLALGQEVQQRRIGKLVLEDIEELSEPMKAQLHRYLQSRQAMFADWSPDGRILITTRFGETEQAHLVGGPMGARRQLTFFREPVTFANFSPSEEVNGFVFLKDQGGDEKYQIYFFDMETRGYEMLTDGESRNGAPVWSHSGKQLAFFSNKRDGIHWDIYVASPASGDKPRMVLETEDAAWYPTDWSVDDKQLLVWKYRSTNDSELFVLDLESGSLSRIDPSEEPVGINHALFSKDGKGIYIASDKGSEFRQLRYVDLTDGSSIGISDHIPWDVETFDLSRDGQLIAYSTNENGLGRMHVYDIQKRKARGRLDLPAGRLDDSLSFDPDGKRIAFTLDTARSPRDVYVHDLRNRALTRWTQSEVGGLDTNAFSEPELIRYRTFDERGGEAREIPAFLYRPTAKPPHPVIIYIHGGPESQFRPGFNGSFQFYVQELGYALLAPNVRGSAGYGKSYLLLDNGFKREDSVRDIGALLDWIRAEPSLDEGRIVVLGGSYGGYMVLASMARYNERLLGGIDVVGISNFVTFLENTSDYRRDLRRAEYGDERDNEMRKFLAKISPNNQADKITKPLLVVQGLNDPRVPASESEQMVATIRKNGGRVWYLLAEDEGHGFRKKRNRDVYYATVVSFLDSLLRK